MDRREPVAHSESNVFQILLWFLFIVALLGFGARIGTKFAMTRKLASDDWIMLAAQIAYLAECISISIGASQGLDNSNSTATDDSVNTFLQAEYASVGFLIIALALVKFSVSAFIHQLSPNRTHVRLNRILLFLIGSWALAAFFTLLFECGLPSPWDYIDSLHCIDRAAWWAFVAIGNIATELLIVALYTLIIGNLKLPLAKKAVVLTIFSTRLLVIGIVVAQLLTFLRVLPRTQPSDEVITPILLNQGVIVASIITACTPYLRPIMESLESSIVRVENISSDEEIGGPPNTRRTGGSRYYLSDMSHSSAACSSRATNRVMIDPEGGDSKT
ncbi:hypothetical protein F5Y16DRAFT_422723 [Xylariaceae sp. FL0255]|nr:hypothetical protein F5Y16DRAFT_422723 [Xylariaceae sp. FL0255]